MQIKNHFATDHQRGEALTGEVMQFHPFSGDPTAPEHRQLISYLLHLVEFMADKSNGLALGSHSFQGSN